MTIDNGQLTIGGTARITGRRNALVRHIKKLGNERKYRYESGEFLCAGLRCLREAVSCGSAITAVLAVRDAPEFAGLPVTLVSGDILEYASPLKTARDVVFAVKMPAWDVAELLSINALCARGASENTPDIAELLREAPINTPGVCVLDGVQDPGNVGAVIRTAAAFGLAGVLLLNNCADPYNPKTVRATMGAIFRLPVAEVGIGELREAVSRGLTLYGAAADGDTSAAVADFSGASVAIGGEGAGLSREVLALCREKVYIPMEPGAESLNAATAAAVLMWEMYRR